mmetsp:Transcript_37513/g.74689  ORF Transcript_37513/g.74689 Transcript_37513/m.74689 type:complete len:361 (-) Transcript_37513:125-1207(-)
MACCLRLVALVALGLASAWADESDVRGRKAIVRREGAIRRQRPEASERGRPAETAALEQAEVAEDTDGGSGEVLDTLGAEVQDRAADGVGASAAFDRDVGLNPAGLQKKPRRNKKGKPRMHKKQLKKRGNQKGKSRMQKKELGQRGNKEGKPGTQKGQIEERGDKKGKAKVTRKKSKPTPKPTPAPTPPAPNPATPFPTLLPGLPYAGPARPIGSGPAAIQLFDRLSFNNERVDDAGCKPQGRVLHMQFSSELDLSPCQCIADTTGKLAVSVCTHGGTALNPGPLKFRIISTCDGTATTFHGGFEGQLHLLANLMNPYYDDRRFANEWFGRKCTYVHDFPLEFQFTGGIKLSNDKICRCT